MDEIEQLKIDAGISTAQNPLFVQLPNAEYRGRAGGPKMEDRVPPKNWPNMVTGEISEAADDPFALEEDAGAAWEQDLNEDSFGSAEEMLQFTVGRIRQSLKDLNEDPDGDPYYVVEDMERLLNTLDNSQVGR